MRLLQPGQFEALRWQAEAERCALDYRYLAATYLRFKPKEELGGRPTLVFNRVQNYLYERMEDQWRRTGYVRQIWGKVRQVGATTFCRGLAFHQVAFHRNRNALFVAHDEPSALAIFAEYDKSWLNDLPPELQPQNRLRSRLGGPLRKPVDKRDAMEFTSLKTRSLANHALNANVGASQMTHMLHYTEAGRVTRTAESVWTSIQPSLSSAKSKPDGGFLQDHSIGIIESTSKYGGFWYKTVAERAMAGEFDEWEFVFVPWTMLDAYSIAVPPNFVLTAEETELRRRHTEITLGNLAWRRGVKSTYVTRPLDFYQEYAMTWEESWVAPEGTERVFPPDVCDALRAKDDGQAIRPGLRFDVGQPTATNPTGLTRIAGGALEVWALPEEGEFYDLGVDIAGGESDAADWTVLEVVKRSTLEQVAEARLHVNPASREFEDLVYWTGMAYNAAQVNPDATGGWGYSLLEALRRRSYPAIFIWRHYDAKEQDLSQRLGYVYTRRSKAMLINTTVTLLYRGEVTLHSSVLLSPDPTRGQEGELESFLQVGDSWGAKHGAFDDGVNALMLALISARDETGAPAPPPEVRREPTPAEARPWAVQDIDAIYEAEDLLHELSRSGLGVWAEY